jgi:hypothetical protein
MWIDGFGGPMYDAQVGGNLVLALPPGLRITVLVDSPDGVARAHIQIGKEFNPRSGPRNRTTFEATHDGVEGWVDPGSLVEEFPAANTFDIPELDTTLPRLYHGSELGAITAIMAGRFSVPVDPMVGRSFGDGVYATPYVSTAAVHAFGVADQAGKPNFAVGLLIAPPLGPGGVREPRILIHDRLREQAELEQVGQGLSVAEQSHRVTARMHPGKLVETAVTLARGQPVSRAEITAAARVHSYDVVIYSGHPGDTVYVLLRVSDWKLDSIVLRDTVTTAPQRRSDLQDLDWYHEATRLDREQDARNWHGRW